MIKLENLKNVLENLNFKEIEKNIFSKKFEKLDCELKVDFNKQKLIYPEDKGLKINDKTTSNFKANENFVVFECVNRLFEQGYNPKHIELEPKWQVGHGGSGGKADILVKDNSGNSLLIIECKTAGGEFNSAWKNTQVRPTQVFSYAQQTKTTKFIALYASDFVDGKVKSDYYLISLVDNKELLENNKKLKSYKEASTVEEIYEVWSETYKKEYATIGLFENNEAYKIGKTKFSIDDLKIVSSKDISGKYHEFATILRQHNVSGRENAFDRLVNLFLCKVVDEKNNPQELEFYWKGIAYDDPFALQDRLQKLYSEGMEKFLGEKITYIDNSQIDNAFRVFKDKPNATKDVVKEYFKQLKFFTNNDFAFIDIHNEKLFYQNFEVLLKILKTFQDIKLTATEENQFLGDMFEGFLDQGVKQSEGQFFTPMPIVKFIIHSLPKKENPKVIDYACGAGHFLNEYALKNKDSKIYGIEKEYRLSKVAKVSAFMYGNDDMEVVYADGLVKNPKIEENSFDVLVANPPYSVKGFLETLSEEDREKFEISKSIDKKSYSTNNSIECFFIERAKQLLKDGGVASIIVPSSILNKGNKVYSTTREIILKYFHIIAIYESGSGTFGKTGTNTVTLFLKKRKTNPTQADHFKNMVDLWFDGNFELNKENFKDSNILEKYCNYMEYNFSEYKEFLENNVGIDCNQSLQKTEIFEEYIKEFEKLTTTKNYKKKSFYKNFSEEEKQNYNFKNLIDFIKEIEKEKVYYFALADNNETDVVIVKSPAKNTEIKKFLGYEWSSSKGNEGIQYITNNNFKIDNEELEDDDKRVLENINSLSNIQTPLYNPNNFDDETKINTIIKNNFNCENCEIPENLQKFVSKSKLQDMLDFSRTTFDKAINLNPKRKIEILTQFPLIKLGENIKFEKKSKRPASSGLDNGKFPFFTSSQIQNKFVDEADYKDENIIIGDGGKSSIFIAKNFSVSDHNFVFKSNNENLLNRFIYIFFLINFNFILDGLTGSGLQNISKSYLQDLKIPLPPLDIQQKIVDECELVDKEVEKAEKEIEEGKNEIEKIIGNVEGEVVKLGEIAEEFYAGGDKPKEFSKEKTDKLAIPIYANGVKENGLFGFTNIFRTEKPCITISARGTIGFTVSRNEKFWPIVRLIVLIPNLNKALPKYLEIVLNLKKIEKSGGTIPQLTVPQASNLEILLPSLDIQEKIVKEIEKIEEKIEESKKVVEGAKERKEEVLKKYL